MTDEPVNLDRHCGIAAQRDTEIRRDLHEVQADQAALRGRQEELENFLNAAPELPLAAQIGLMLGEHAEHVEEGLAGAPRSFVP